MSAYAHLLLEPSGDQDSKVPLGFAQKVAIIPRWLLRPWGRHLELCPFFHPWSTYGLESRGEAQGRDWNPGPCSLGQCLLAFFLFFLKLKYNVHIKNSTYIIHEQLEEFSQTQHQIQQ